MHYGDYLIGAVRRVRIVSEDGAGTEGCRHPTRFNEYFPGVNKNNIGGWFLFILTVDQGWSKDSDGRTSVANAVRVTYL